ncbi:uncharacterized protein N7477_002215 [Penicillium maclennaniae]|uniref:uncharacterized protein n=1 Tax=Penicillium maclennaniae TaxID=1343394 RepID=UPI0025412F9D|nr:uncharacterized protein N7477_002215 [Penicillium maclennaniae]KAJ5676582.1 hypothetical protein N7477_002215 [Penicillium maclennaniae]
MLVPRGWRGCINRALMAVLPPFNFLTLHYLYFIVASVVASTILFSTSTPVKDVAYSDAIFLCISAMTGAGLNTVDFTVLLVRKRAFEAKLKSVSDSREASQRTSTLELQNMNPELQDESYSNIVESRMRVKTAVGVHESPAQPSSIQIQWTDDDQITMSDEQRYDHHHHHHPHNHRVFRMVGVGARPDLNNHPRDAIPLPLSADKPLGFGLKGMIRSPQQYLLSKGVVSRNSQFHGLSSIEREELGGVEYKAVSFLSWIVSLYFISFNLLGIIGMSTWLQANHPEVTRGNGLDPFWTGAFFAVSAFVNSGMSLLDKNMTALQLDAYPLLTLGMLILAGNTLYPCFLRFIIWTMRDLMPNNPRWESWRVTLDFILNHPRRVYTNLFPARHTWYLLGTIIILNGIDWAAFELLSIGNKEIQALPSEYRALDGLFQALAVRAGGFYVVTIADLRQGLLVLYVLMMYVSAYPVLVTIRNTNVYEERSLGIYAHDDSPDSPDRPARGNVFLDIVRHHMGRPTFSERSRSYFVHEQLRSQLSHDIWWIAVAVLFIAIAESDHYSEQPVAFATFNIVFEVVSAYGCVGFSVGYPGKNYSFCGAWHTISKLILAAVALRGRHRGLPVAIDKAIMLPSESLAWAEEEDAAFRRERARAWQQDRMPAGTV